MQRELIYLLQTPGSGGMHEIQRTAPPVENVQAYFIKNDIEMYDEVPSRRH